MLTMLGLSLITTSLKDAVQGAKSDPCQGQGTALPWMLPSTPGDHGPVTRGMAQGPRDRQGLGWCSGDCTHPGEAW